MILEGVTNVDEPKKGIGDKAVALEYVDDVDTVGNVVVIIAVEARRIAVARSRTESW